MTVTNSSQGGGGIFVHAWGHNLQIANNRVYGNIGTLSGGISIGQGESPDAYLQGSAADSDPGSCKSTSLANQQLPYCFDLNVNVHHNMVTLNTSIGDELFSGTPAGAGGVSFCTGADYYSFKYNWICGNQSTGDGGGVAHIGYSWNGDIEHNAIIFNQSVNPTIQTNGGGLIVMGAAPDGMTAAGVECGGTVADADCPPGLPDGTGPNLTINANLIMGNAAESGSGGGLRLQSVNGTEVQPVPADARGLEQRQHHQQHHCQQRGGMGWCRCLAAGRTGGELHQQHGDVERHHGILRCAVQHTRRTGLQCTGSNQPDELADHLSSAAGWPGDDAEQFEPDEFTGQYAYYVSRE